MSGINTGILTNAYPLSAEQIKELEKQVLEKHETIAYLNESRELCFAMPFDADDIKELAWHNVYEVCSLSDGSIFKQEYKKAGLASFYAGLAFHKSTLDATWDSTYGLLDEIILK